MSVLGLFVVSISSIIMDCLLVTMVYLLHGSRTVYRDVDQEFLRGHERIRVGVRIIGQKDVVEEQSIQAWVFASHRKGISELLAKCLHIELSYIEVIPPRCSHYRKPKTAKEGHTAGVGQRHAST